jgi:WD40 repeat protein
MSTTQIGEIFFSFFFYFVVFPLPEWLLVLTRRIAHAGCTLLHGVSTVQSPVEAKTRRSSSGTPTRVSVCRTSPGTQGKFLTSIPSAFSKQFFLCMLTDLNDFSDVNTVTFSPDAKSLASGSDDETLKLWGPSLDK